GINYNNIINKSSAGADCISLSEIIGEPIGLSSIKESTELSLKILDTSKYFLNNENNIIEKYSEKSIVLNKVVEIILSDGSIIKSEVKKIGINGELILSSGENILNAERLRLL
nr:hypothetical protein [Candidatus Dependentiae bacterium]